ncbi:MAG: M3 family metallopeptidase, partial [Wenzhouxiangella sp.]|nr:M3 family metallopeptidase [Wenzhouxiangella sp.]
MTSNDNPSNPLLAGGLPRFGAIRPEHAVEALKQRLDEYQIVIDQIAAEPESVDYASVVEAETLADNALATVWSTIAHLHGVQQSPAWREVYPACLEELTRFHTQRSQNRELYLAYKTLRGRPDFEQQSPAIKACIEHELTEFRLGGVGLPEPDRRRFAEINLRLSALGNQFGNHVLDATEAYKEHFERVEQLAGLPPQELELLAGMASSADKSGWMATLSYPSYKAIVTYADDRALRERFHRAYVTRASELGPNAGEFDNTPIVSEMLALRATQAGMLGFDSYARLRLEKRMAENPEAIESFLLELADLARPKAREQLSELAAFAESLGAQLPLAPWDLAYYSEKLREQQLGISQDKLKPWLEVENVFSGLFGVAEALFDLRFVADESVETWHRDARYYRVERGGEPMAGL